MVFGDRRIWKPEPWIKKKAGFFVLPLVGPEGIEPSTP